jgi:hypothetical protein
LLAATNHLLLSNVSTFNCGLAPDLSINQTFTNLSPVF